MSITRDTVVKHISKYDIAAAIFENLRERSFDDNIDNAKKVWDHFIKNEVNEGLQRAIDGVSDTLELQ